MDPYITSESNQCLLNQWIMKHDSSCVWVLGLFPLFYANTFIAVFLMIVYYYYTFYFVAGWMLLLLDGDDFFLYFLLCPECSAYSEGKESYTSG